MGVYIKGMDMPNSCMACPLFSGNGCRATKTLFAAITNVASRVDSCPLIEVPEPHGRLIDEDNLIVATKAFLPWSFETEAERGQYFQLDLFKTIIEETPTVIERSNNE